MKQLFCKVYDQDRFFRELIVEFISKTPGISLMRNSGNNADITIIDTDLNTSEFLPKHSNSQLIVVSSKEKYVLSIFKNQIADYLHKPDLSYVRFQAAIDKARKRMEENVI